MKKKNLEKQQAADTLQEAQEELKDQQQPPKKEARDKHKDKQQSQKKEVQEEPKDDQQPPKKEPWTAGRVLKEIYPYLIVVAAALFLNTFIITNARTPSASRETTVMTGEHVFGNRLAYINSDPKRYEIIIFKFPDDESRLFIKRIIGLPGDTIEVKNGDVYINGVNDMENEQQFISSNLYDNFGPYTVPEDSYFVMGDNRGHSNDSRFWDNKCVKRSKIVGRAGFRYWPLNKIGFINKYADN